MKVNPLATWSDLDVEGYIQDRALPVHPLAYRGLPVARLLAVQPSRRRRRARRAPAVGRAATRSSAASTADASYPAFVTAIEPAGQRQLSNLDALEAESIHIIREVAAEFERPVLLFSGGKDSAVMLHLAVKAFWPARVPFPVMHVDTGHNFPEALDYRDRRVEELGIELVVASVPEAIEAGRVVEDREGASRNRLQTTVLLEGIEQHRFDAVFGGGRRDEEKARAKERVLLAPRRVRAVGPEEPAARAVESLQRSPQGGRAHPRSSRCRTGPSSTSGSTSRRSRSSSPPSTSPTTATCSAATG